ncbi:MAG TPA: OmpH family outer membrane protein [Verrucomicrobiae bacterium]|nr:OmpH family outer membrane protein [Verrucomicrobiae bacterium]
MKRTALALCATLGLVAGAQAQMKICTVDLNKIFEGYYKTEQAKATVNTLQNNYNNDRKIKTDDYTKRRDEVVKLRDEANNPALSADIKQQKNLLLQEKGKELLALEREIMEFDRQRRGDIQQQMLRMRNEVVKEITDTVQAIAKQQGYTLVFDRTGQSMAAAPLLVYANEQLDFSQAVIDQLNAGRPKGTAAPAAAPAAPAAPR